MQFPYNPGCKQPVWTVLGSLAATKRITLFSFPLGTQMFQFPRFRSMLTHDLQKTEWLPNSEIFGSQFCSNFPKLIAGIHVFHRLLMPRHPPFALCNFFLYFLQVSNLFFAQISKIKFCLDKQNLLVEQKFNLFKSKHKHFLRIPFNYLKKIRKEVVHPHVLVGIPCYDLTPITDVSLVKVFLAVRRLPSGTINFRGLTGGVYKTRERIHRDIADSRLLAIPTS